MILCTLQHSWTYGPQITHKYYIILYDICVCVCVWTRDICTERANAVSRDLTTSATSNDRSLSGLVASLLSAKRPLAMSRASPIPTPPHLSLAPIEAYYYLSPRHKIRVRPRVCIYIYIFMYIIHVDSSLATTVTGGGERVVFFYTRVHNKYHPIRRESCLLRTTHP